MPSSVGSITVEKFPVDTIDSPTPCALHIPYNRKGKTIHVATRTAYPGHSMHGDVLPVDYARVEVLSVSPHHLEYEVEIPARDGETVLGNLVGYFIVWQRRDIVVLTPSLGAPPTSSQPQLPQLEQQVDVLPTGEALEQMSCPYEQQVQSFMDDTVPLPNANVHFSYDELMHDIIAGRALPDLEEACTTSATHANEETQHDDRTHEGAEHGLEGSSPPRPPPPSTSPPALHP